MSPKRRASALLMMWVILPVTIVLFTATLMLTVALLPVLIPAQIVLVKAGRRGFVVRSGNGRSVTLDLNPAVFRRV